MAVSAVSSGSEISLRGSPAPPSFRLYSALVLLLALVVVALTWLLGLEEWSALPSVLPWIVAVGLTGAFPLRTEKGVSLSLDLPVLLAAGFVLGPPLAGVAALVGTIELDEFRGRGSLWLSVCNRAQTALAAMFGALVFHSMGASLGSWPAAGLAAALALLADAAVNYSLVAGGVAMFRRVPVSAVLRDMHIGDLTSFILEYGCFGLLGILLAETFRSIGIFGLVAFVVPLLLAHEVFNLRQRGEVALSALQAKTEAINSLTRKVADERRDERLVMAGELHDEVLPPLFQVHLMGQVIRQDLASGRLLDLDRDVPELLSATDAAQSAIRGVVSSLRSSSLGPSGLVATIELLATQLEGAGSPRFSLELDDIRGSEYAQLLTYQVAREAMNNAARHSRARFITVRLKADQEALRIVVLDDGVGFDPRAVDGSAHFGLQFMRERVEALGGRLAIDARLGQGTCVSAAIPLDA